MEGAVRSESIVTSERSVAFLSKCCTLKDKLPAQLTNLKSEPRKG